MYDEGLIPELLESLIVMSVHVPCRDKYAQLLRGLCPSPAVGDQVVPPVKGVEALLGSQHAPQDVPMRKSKTVMSMMSRIRWPLS